MTLALDCRLHKEKVNQFMDWENEDFLRFISTPAERRRL